MRTGLESPPAGGPVSILLTTKPSFCELSRGIQAVLEARAASERASGRRAFGDC